MNNSLAVYSSPVGSDQQNFVETPSSASRSSDSSSSSQSFAQKSQFLGAVLVFVLSLSFFWISLPNWHFVSRGEAREALVIRGMESQGNYTLPLRNGVDIPSKPPLFHWSAVAMKSIGLRYFHGSEEFFIRLPSALAACGILLLLFCFSSPLLGTRGGLLACVFLFSSIDFLRTAIVARVDMTFAFFIAASTLALANVVRDYVLSRKKNTLSLALATIAIVFGFWTKGPAALAFPWCVAGICMLLLVPLREIPWKSAIGSILVSLLLSLVWYLLAYRVGGKAFLDVHLMRENFARVVGSDEYQTGHSGAFYLPVPLLLLGLLPFSLALPLIPKMVRSRVALPNRKPHSEFGVSILYCLIWGLFFPLFFSFTASQRSVYLLPCFPAWAFLLAAFFVRQGSAVAVEESLPRTENGFRNVVRWLAGVLGGAVVSALLLLLIPGALRLFHLKEHDLSLAESIRTGIFSSPIGLLCFLSISALCFLVFRRARSDSALSSLLKLCLLSVLAQEAIIFSALPATATATTPSPFAARVLAYAQEHSARLYQYDDDFYALNYYLGRDLPRLNAGQNPPPGTSLVFLRAADAEKTQALFPQSSVLMKSELWDVYGKDHFVVLQVEGSPDSTPPTSASVSPTP